MTSGNHKHHHHGQIQAHTDTRVHHHHQHPHSRHGHGHGRAVTAGDGAEKEDEGPRESEKSMLERLTKLYRSQSHGPLSHDGRIRSFARYCPLIAAILAPFSTLMDIPALSQHWCYIDGVVQSDYKACIALSAVGLTLNVIANMLLIVRFSSSSPSWSKYSTLLSTVFWVGKTAIAILNCAIFGSLIAEKPGYSFGEAFWCAIVSVIVAGCISLALLCHYTLGYEKEGEDAVEVRTEGKKFMLSVTVFMVILGFQSLAFCRLEGWTYSDAIYFSTQTALTIGYGDLLPTTTASKVLVFCFSVLTISQLGNEIALIISFMSGRAEARRDKWRARYEGAMHREANALRPKATLLEEMALIYEINSREELMNQLVDLIWSAISLIVFWVVGATIFSQLEGWTYGNAIYAVMVLSLTIGFGDFTPATPAGRVVFIVYALMAVPIVTSFAVQTITGLLSTYSTRGEIKDSFLRDRKRNPQAFIPHADHVLHAHESYAEMRSRLLGNARQSHDDDDDDEDDNDNDKDNTDHPRSIEMKKGSLDPSNTVESEGSGATAVDRSDPVSQLKDVVPGPKAATATGGRSHRFGDRLTLPHKEGWRDYIREEENKSRSEAEKPLNEVENMIRHAHEEVEKIIRMRRSHESGIHLLGGGGGAGAVGGGGRGGGIQMDGGEDAAEVDADDQEFLNEEKKAQELESALVKKVLTLTIQMEAEARQMLLDSMDKGVARTLLLADRNVQERDVRAMRQDQADMISIWRGVDTRGADRVYESSSLDMLSRVSKYRNTFASILVLGSILQRLTGDDLNRFERWRHTPSRAGSPRPSRPTSPHSISRSRSRPLSQSQSQSQSRTQSFSREMEQDVESVAEEHFGGLTGLMLRQHTRQLRKGSGSLRRGDDMPDGFTGEGKGKKGKKVRTVHW